MSSAVLQPAIVMAAFWLALALHQRRDPAHTPRFAASLLVGAAATHLGWIVCFSPEIGWRALDLAGASVLFLPLGPLLCARSAASFASLPLPIALSRLGCLASGCCRGDMGVLLPLLDGVAFVLLDRLCRGLPDRKVGSAFLGGFGAIRLAETPWRTSVDSFALASPSLVASGWIFFAAAVVARDRNRVTNR